MSLRPIVRVLCVEDNSLLREALKTGLEIYGFEVVTASNGLDALKQYASGEGQFSVIVTDHDMPQMNGLEFIRAVRGRGYQGRVVVMSGHLRVDELRAYGPYAVSGFFHKPFEVVLLAAMLLRAG